MPAEDPLQSARRYLAEGRADLAVALLRETTRQSPDDSSTWALLGFAYHEEQLEPEAADAFARAFRLDSRDANTAMALAQSRFLAGLPAVKSFRQVLQLAPDDLNVLRGYASALESDHQRDAAEEVLRAALDHHPDWLAGHKCLASLRYTSSDKRHFADSFAQACARQPDNLALRLEWFRTVAQTRDWPESRRIVEEGERMLGPHPHWQIAKLFIASESHDDATAARLFAETASLNDLVRDMALIRYSLRHGDLDTAEQTAMRHVNTRSAPVIWPYLSLVWRLKGDARAEWLDGSGRWVRSFDLDLSARELERIAGLLRQLHTARSPYAEQSVRGGTQTDLNLFLRHEPLLRDLRARIQAAVRQYVEQLPPPVTGHPLLGVDRQEALRGRMHFSGSWSVRLQSGGYNVSHTHPVGWLSSALYISLPEPERMGEPPAGWIQFGTPPPELGLDLEPYQRVEPKAGRLVLFPSTLWHSTVPFEDGERLVVSFDVRAPRPLAPSRSTDQSSEPS